MCPDAGLAQGFWRCLIIKRKLLGWIAEQDNYATPLIRDDFHRSGQFVRRRSTKAEHVFKRIKRVGAHQYRRGAGDVTFGKGDVFGA